MLSHAWLSQGWLKTSPREGSTTLSDLLNVLVPTLAGSSFPRICFLPAYLWVFFILSVSSVLGETTTYAVVKSLVLNLLLLLTEL